MPRTRDLIGTLVDNRYELLSLLGEGAFGTVYLGQDRRLARIVAIKLIKPSWAEDPDWVQSFVQEARMLARVSDPGIVQIFDVGRGRQGPYYVAEFVDGESLASRLRRGPLQPRAACDLAAQLSRALGHAHEQRVVHRDVKPANILISARGQVKVGDFGVARLTGSTTEAPPSMILGTPRYMAPEQARGKQTTPATDVYSVGVVLYEMLAGRTPFNGDSPVAIALAHETQSLPPLPEIVPQPLAHVVARALEKDPERRYADGHALARALARARPRASEPPPPPPAADGVGRDEARTTMLRGDASPQTGARPRPLPVPALTGSAPTATGPDATATATVAATDRPTATAAANASDSTDGAVPAARPRPRTRGEEPHVRAASASRRRGSDRRPEDVLSPTRVAPHETLTMKRTRRERLGRPAVVVLAVGLIAGALLIIRTLTAPTVVPVPNIHGLTATRAQSQLRRAGLQSTIVRHYASGAIGTAVAQQPAAGAHVDSGTLVTLVISQGPPPVPVPKLIGEGAGAAGTVLSSLHLNSTVKDVPAPGKPPGLVTGQDPRAGTYLPQHHLVTLLVAEQPQWRTVTSFSGSDSDASVPFQIQGTRWRAIYSMSYGGTCTFIFFCEGPTATAIKPQSGAQVNQFSLNGGSDQSQVFDTGPGIYQLKVAAGLDDAQWSVQIQDWY